MRTMWVEAPATHWWPSGDDWLPLIFLVVFLAVTIWSVAFTGPGPTPGIHPGDDYCDVGSPLC